MYTKNEQKVQGGKGRFNHLNNFLLQMLNDWHNFRWKSSWMFECFLNPLCFEKNSFFFCSFFSLSSLSLKGKPVRDLGILWTIEFPEAIKSYFHSLKHKMLTPFLYHNLSLFSLSLSQNHCCLHHSSFISYTT